MSSPNERLEKNRLLFDELYWEVSVLEACCWGAYFVSREQFCTRFESMEVALFHEFRRFRKMLESLNLGMDKGKGKDAEADN